MTTMTMNVESKQQQTQSVREKKKMNIRTKRVTLISDGSLNMNVIMLQCPSPLKFGYKKLH